MFFVVAIEDTFFTRPIGRASKITHPKNRAARKNLSTSDFWILNSQPKKKILDLIVNSFQQLSAKSLKKNWDVYKKYKRIDTLNLVLWSHVKEWHIERLNLSIVS